MKITKEIEKSASELIERTKEDLSADSWLKKAVGYGAKRDYKSAIDAYLKFLEVKLHIIRTRPGYGANSYLGLVKYYVKIAECYENVRHITLEERVIDLENAAKYYIKAAEMFKELKDYTTVQKYYETAARCYGDIKKYDKAAECYLEIAGMYNKLNDKVLAISAYTNAADFYEMSGNYEESLGIWLNIANLDQDTGNIRGASSGYKKVGDCYRKTGKFQDALSYYMRSAEIITETEHYTEIAGIYKDIASSYGDLGDYENAIHYYLKSADLSIKGKESDASSSYRSIAECYEKLGGYSEAIKYYLKSCDIESRLKNYRNLISCYRGMAKCYDGMGEYKKGADMYFQSAEYASVDDKGSNGAKEGYRKAAEIYARIAEEGLRKGDYKDAMENYKKIADCYDRVNDYAGSAAAYGKYADLMKEINYEDAVHTYSKTAERYARSGDMKQAAYYYTKSRDYANSAKFYRKYAELNKNNQFLVAEGYRMAANAYKKLKKTDDEKDYYNKAISQYILHMEKLERMGEEVDKEDIYKKIAECYNELDDMPNTKKNLEEALKFYNAGTEDQKAAINALLSKTNAKLAIKTGDYSTAGRLLNDALNLFNKSIKEGNFDDVYNAFLEENKNEIMSLLGQIKLKPAVVLNVEQPVQQLGSGAFEIKGVISNKGDQDVYGVLILPNTPQGFRVLKSPETIEVLKPMESTDIVIQLDASLSGEFKFAPLEVLYKDITGNKYMKASNEISINIRGLHGEYRKETMGVEGGYNYLVEEVIPDRSVSIFADIINKGAKGLYISREHPDRIKEKFPSNVSVIWLSSVAEPKGFRQVSEALPQPHSQKSKDIVNPTDLVELGHIIREFIEKNRDSVILLDGIEYLITQNGYEEILKFIQSINDTVASSDSRLIIPINPKALNLQQLTLLERECRVL